MIWERKKRIAMSPVDVIPALISANLHVVFSMKQGERVSDEQFSIILTKVCWESTVTDHSTFDR